MIEIKKNSCSDFEIQILDKAFMGSLTKKATLLIRVGPVRDPDGKLRVSDEQMAEVFNKLEK